MILSIGEEGEGQHRDNRRQTHHPQLHYAKISRMDKYFPKMKYKKRKKKDIWQ